MRISSLILKTLREAPNDALIASHALMIRADLVRKLGNGLYAYMPLGLRVKRKVENIIREELDISGFNEIACTVIVPGELWQRSGRFDKMAGEMLAIENRTGQKMVVSPTCEEGFTYLIGLGLSSYKDLPITAYQINTKYRDEIRPRYGVMRGREFTMMDAYSFNTDEKSLDATYNEFSACYRRIFRRLGLNTINVRASTGAMGGSASEEFMVASPVGDDTLILCNSCGYAANVEKASCKGFDITAENIARESEIAKSTPQMERVDCPGVESISQMESFFQMKGSQFIKVLLYKISNSSLKELSKDCEKDKKENDQNARPNSSKPTPPIFVAVAIRGDLDVNESKLAAGLLATSAELASTEEVIEYTGAPHGFVGPVGLKNGVHKLPLVVDESVITRDSGGNPITLIHDAVTGSGTKDVDLKHVEPLRDFTPDITLDLRTVKDGDLCPQCGAPLYSKKGNELGHIFKLGDKYTKSMGVTFLDTNGKPATPIMGCYGIGVDRTLASVIEEYHDEKGIKWPMSCAPYQVVIIPISYNGVMKDISDKLHDDMQKAGLEVLLDDRKERAGVKFCDADLIGIPIRIIISERNLPNVELKLRKNDEVQLIDKDCVIATCKDIIQNEIAF